VTAGIPCREWVLLQVQLSHRSSAIQLRLRLPAGSEFRARPRCRPAACAPSLARCLFSPGTHASCPFASDRATTEPQFARGLQYLPIAFSLPSFPSGAAGGQLRLGSALQKQVGGRAPSTRDRAGMVEAPARRLVITSSSRAFDRRPCLASAPAVARLAPAQVWEPCLVGATRPGCRGRAGRKALHERCICSAHCFKQAPQPPANSVSAAEHVRPLPRHGRQAHRPVRGVWPGTASP